jgi:chromosomal replication initiator protein
MKSRRRSRNAQLPRQVSMFLARQLTGLTLEEIGSYFGGRDHSTVLHACRKVEETLDRDTDLAGTVRQLHADLA